MPFLIFWSGSFAVQYGDHFRSGIICGSIWGSCAVRDHLRSWDHLRTRTVHQLKPRSLSLILKFDWLITRWDIQRGIPQWAYKVSCEALSLSRASTLSDTKVLEITRSFPSCLLPLFDRYVWCVWKWTNRWNIISTNIYKVPRTINGIWWSINRFLV